MSELGISIPPGDPDALVAAGHDLEVVARAFAHTGHALHGIAHVSGWHGTASAQFAHAAAAAEPPARVADEQLRQAAKVLEQLANELRHARRAAQHAIEAARTADGRQRAAEHDASDAQRRMRAVNDQATALRRDIAAAAAYGDPATASRAAHHDATRAAADARAAAVAACGRADVAAHELAAAQRAGLQAEDRYQRACEHAARALRAVAGAAPGHARPPHAPTHDTLGDATFDYLTAALLNIWNGGPGERYLPIGKLGKALVQMYGTARFVEAYEVARSWERVAPGGPGTFTALARALRTEAMPTFNNGLLGRGVRGVLDRAPGMERAAGWFGDASRATPIFRRLGVAGGIASTALDVDALIHGDPGKHPAAFASDLARTGFDVSTTAFLVAPNPVTAGAVVVTGALWAGTEIVQHRKEIGHALDKGIDIAGHGLSSASHAIGHLFGG